MIYVTFHATLAAERVFSWTTGAFRVMYVAKFSESVYVLHAFQKKTQKTAQKDLDLAKTRYQELTTKRK
jgi:phage-related protein